MRWRAPKKEGKMKKKLDPIQQWEKATKNLLDEFLKIYFVDEDIPIEDIDVYWVGDEIGGVCFINDMYFGLDDLVNCLRHKPSRDQMWDWYYKSLEAYEKGESFPNLKNFIKLMEGKDGN